MTPLKIENGQHFLSTSPSFMVRSSALKVRVAVGCWGGGGGGRRLLSQSGNLFSSQFTSTSELSYITQCSRCSPNFCRNVLTAVWFMRVKRPPCPLHISYTTPSHRDEAKARYPVEFAQTVALGSLLRGVLRVHFKYGGTTGPTCYTITASKLGNRLPLLGFAYRPLYPWYAFCSRLFCPLWCQGGGVQSITCLTRQLNLEYVNGMHPTGAVLMKNGRYWFINFVGMQPKKGGDNFSIGI